MTQLSLVDQLAIAAPVDVPKPASDDQRMWSVTTIIGVLDKPALLYWAAEQTALAAVAVRRTLAERVEEEGEEAIVKWLRDARFRRPKDQLSATDLGTAVHAGLEYVGINGRYPERDEHDNVIMNGEGTRLATENGRLVKGAEVWPFFEQFDRFCQRFQPTWEAAEVTVYDSRYSYAGTLDAVISIDGVRFITDFKTSAKSHDSRGKETGPYPEQVALQLAAYRYAEMAATWRPRRYLQRSRRYYLLGDEERSAAVPVPEVDTGLVVHITPEHCRGYPIRVDEEVHRSFLYVLECARWIMDTSRTVLGDPLE